MIDIHCHLLPGIDDGPRDTAQALELARALVRDGVSHAVCTPHIYPSVFDNNPESIRRVYDEFLIRLTERTDIPLTISYSAEVRVSAELILMARKRELPTMKSKAGVESILVEMPDAQVPIGMDNVLRELMQIGIQPIIAHPERNKQIMSKPSLIEALIEKGARVQVTAASVIGKFGGGAQAAAHLMLKNHWVHAVANDAHNTVARAPQMTPAYLWLQKNLGLDRANDLVINNPAEWCGR